MDEKTILKVLTDAQVGDIILVQFKPGQGKKGTMTSDERVAFLRFVAMTGIQGGSEKHLKPDGDESLGSLELLVVGQSGYWDRCKKERSFTVVKKLSSENAVFFANRIGPVLNEFSLVPAQASSTA